MKMNQDAPKLIGGPYQIPKIGRRRSVTCRRYGCAVEVIGMSDSPIPWPLCRPGGGRPSLVLCGDLIRAVATESAEAVAWHWGVSPWTVTTLRRALGITYSTPGTRRAKGLRAGTYTTRGHWQPRREVAEEEA